MLPQGGLKPALRGLQAIYLIDQLLGKRYAKQYKNENDYLKMMAELIMKGAISTRETGLGQE
jgi:hypothetical protein